MKPKIVRHWLMALAATVALAGQLHAQGTGTVRGRVTDAGFAAPLADVTVTVAGQSVLSGSGGFFLIQNVPAGVHELEATLIGYRPFTTQVTVAAGAETDVPVQMYVAPMEMAPIVAIGYGETETKDLTGVVTEVPTEAFNTGRVISAEELIKGKVAGVEVTEANGGEPGGGISIRIRGGTSVNASNEPLYVIDGVPIPVGGGLSSGRNPLNFLTPDDIESFTVLKDASATAIYGSQGANGVVIITTKSGKGSAGQTQVTFTGNFSGSNVSGRPDLLTTGQFREAVAAQAPQQLIYLGTADTNWRDAVYQNAFGGEGTLAVAGGAEKLSFRVALGYLNQQGVIKASETQRVSLNLAYNQLLFNDRLSLQASVLGSRNDDQFTPGLVVGAANNFAPTQPVYDSASPYAGFFEWDDPLAGVNPLGELETVTDEGTTYRSVGNVTGEYALPWLDGLSVTGRAGYLVTNSDRATFAPTFNKNQVNRGLNGTVSRSTPSEFGYSLDTYLTYNTSWDANALNVTGGYAYYHLDGEYPSFYAQQLSTDLLGIDGIPSAELERTFLTTDESAIASWFARANYSYADKYLLTATFRTDGSSKFGDGNKWGNFPSAAVAWRMSEESFMSGADWLSNLKLRLSWGINGNQAFPNYQQYKDYVFGDPLVRYQFGDEFVSTVRPSAADPNIKWETTESWNIGFDYGINEDRFWGSFEFYTKNTDDLIFDVFVAGGSNLSNVVTTNIGTMNNKGFEFTINAGLIEGRGDGFTWDGNFNVSYNVNELTAINPNASTAEQILAGPTISGGVGSTVQVLAPGEAINTFLLYRHKLDADGNPIVGTDAEMYEDTNGDGVVNFSDRVPMESPRPAWIMGHTSLMRWGSFDGSFTLLAQIGNYMYNNVASSTGFYDNLVDSARPNNLHASVLDNQFVTPQYFSDVYLENASFLRLQNLELGYTFRRAMNGMRIYAVVQNVFTITGYSGVDPAATVTGVDNNIYPSTRTFTAGIRFSL